MLAESFRIWLLPTIGADGDSFTLAFDRDLNHAVTPNVDFFYTHPPERATRDTDRDSVR